MSKHQIVVATIKAPNHLRIGEYDPAFGGAFLGLMGSAKGDYYLFRAIGPAAEIGPIEYGGYGYDMIGATDDRDGIANTIALLESGIPHPAAEACRKFTDDGFSDFYMPSREELRLGRMNAPQLFQKDQSYCSSTQRKDHSYYVWCQSFGPIGTQWDSSKYNKLLVCPVRRLLII